MTIILGFVLHKTGKPYNNAIFTLHKLVTIGFTLFLALIVIDFLKTNESNFI
jgi:hypothetical protein